MALDRLDIVGDQRTSSGRPGELTRQEADCIARWTLDADAVADSTSTAAAAAHTPRVKCCLIIFSC